MMSLLFKLSVAMSVLSSVSTANLTNILLDTLCRQISCTNGDCYLVGSAPKCSCNELYTGENCDVINLSKVQFIVIGSMVIFKWPRPPRLKHYSFIYYRIDDPMMSIYARDITIGDHESSALVGNLRDGVTLYRICIEPTDIAEYAVLTQSMDHVTNCVSVSTQPDYHSVFAWFIAACSCVVVVLLIYWQRDKIEILYFNKTVTVNNVVYNYNVPELIRLEKERNIREYQLLHKEEEGSVPRAEKVGKLNRMPLETIEDEN